MSNAMSSFLAGLGAATGQGSNPPYFLAGRYRVQTTEVKFHTSRKHEPLWIVNAKVIASDRADRAAGLVCGQTVMLKQEGAMGNVKNFMLAALGAAWPGFNAADPAHVAAVDDKLTLQWIESGKLVGLVLDLTAHDKPTKTGGVYTVHNWAVPTA